MYSYCVIYLFLIFHLILQFTCQLSMIFILMEPKEVGSLELHGLKIHS